VDLVSGVATINTSLKVFSCDACFETDVEFCAGFGVGNVPHLCLGLSLQGGGDGSGRMDLDRKIVSGIKDLHQEREAFGRMICERWTEDRGALIRPEIMQGLTGGRAILNGDVFVLAVDQLPSFAIIRAIGKLASINGL
jgi:hypothetical protein